MSGANEVPPARVVKGRKGEGEKHAAHGVCFLFAERKLRDRDPDQWSGEHPPVVWDGEKGRKGKRENWRKEKGEKKIAFTAI